MELRKYQSEIVKKMLWAMPLLGNDVICVAQGGGKSHIIADFAHKRGKPILILQPSKELLEQNVAKMLNYVPESEIGIYSASKGRKDINTFTFGTIQSVYKHPEVFSQFDTVMIDECDLVPLKKLGSMYQKFFRQAGVKKVFGFTGTPFRSDTYYKEPPEGWATWKSRRWKNYGGLELVTTTKMITRYKGQFWNRMLCVINTRDLMEQGFLCPLNYIDKSLIQHYEIPTNIGKSEFDFEKFDELIKGKEIEIVQGLKSVMLTHKSVLCFTATIEQAERLAEVFPKAVVVTSKTPAKQRTKAVTDFKAGNIPLMLNVGIFTVGFDYPELDCIVLCRPTRSLRLHCQILGRGTRLATGKTKCDVIDFVGNLKGLGKLEQIKIEKVDGLWDVTSDAHPIGMHMKEMFKFTLQNSTSNSHSDQEDPAL